MGEDVKELETRLSHLEKVSKEYGLEIKLEKTAMLKLSRNGGKNTAVKRNRKKRKEVDGFVCFEVWWIKMARPNTR
jgi:hypothetical protein